MVCETAEELQARLAIRAVLGLLHQEESRASRAGSADDAADGEGTWSTSELHRRSRDEVNAVLKDGLQRRLARLEKKIQLLAVDGPRDEGVGAPGSVPVEQRSSPPEARRPGGAGAGASRCSTGAQTEQGGPSSLLEEVVAAALEKANFHMKPILNKTFGPTPTQAGRIEPAERGDDPVPETLPLKATLVNLERTLSSRERQIGCLQEQLAVVQKMVQERATEAGVAVDALRALRADPKLLEKVHEDRAERRKKRMDELVANLQRAHKQARRYQGIAKQQRCFFLENERVSLHGGRAALNRHPAGEIALHPPPPKMNDEKPEVWDVGSAIANPYIVDSWPFEPNVLARRAPQESPMQPCMEETAEDLQEAERPRNPFLDFDRRLALPERDDDDEDNDGGYARRYGGPSDTSRSL